MQAAVGTGMIILAGAMLTYGLGAAITLHFVRAKANPHYMPAWYTVILLIGMSALIARRYRSAGFGVAALLLLGLSFGYGFGYVSQILGAIGSLLVGLPPLLPQMLMLCIFTMASSLAATGTLLVHDRSRVATQMEKWIAVIAPVVATTAAGHLYMHFNSAELAISAALSLIGFIFMDSFLRTQAETTKQNSISMAINTFFAVLSVSIATSIILASETTAQIGGTIDWDEA